MSVKGCMDVLKSDVHQSEARTSDYRAAGRPLHCFEVSKNSSTPYQVLGERQTRRGRLFFDITDSMSGRSLLNFGVLRSTGRILGDVWYARYRVHGVFSYIRASKVVYSVSTQYGVPFHLLR
jgi:hypothetical protein